MIQMTKRNYHISPLKVAFLSFITLAPAVICASEQENFMFPSQGSSSQWRAILSDDWDVRVLSSTVTI